MSRAPGTHPRVALSLLAACWCAVSCGNDSPTGDSTESGGSAPASGGGPGWSTGGASVSTGGTQTATGGSSCAEAVSGARVHPGNYEYKGCNADGCHIGFSGGWLYPNPRGGYWVPDATITVQNPDGSVVTAYSATDGFFALIGDSGKVGSIQAPYVPCVSKCPTTAVCGSSASHTDIDCQTSNCHGSPNLRVYLPIETNGVGGSSGTGGAPEDPNCVPAALGGPVTHQVDDVNHQPCRICHDGSDPNLALYTGGFVFDGVESDAGVVGQATVTLTHPDGTVESAASGITGMFAFPGIPTAPYTPCISKCPDTTCAAAAHTTTDDCRKCHVDDTRLHLP